MPSSTGSLVEGALAAASLIDADLEAGLRGRGLNLKIDEARRLAAALGRDPAWPELFLFDAMWSEHCSYKSSRHLLKKYLPTEGAHILVGVGEDAGVIRVPTADGDYAVVMAHESHNHPSQVLAHEGAATGVGGIIRDVACMGAEVIGILDALRFGDPFGANAARVRTVMRGVVEGIAHYGDAVGVPNLGGDAEFSPVYDENVLVNVVAMGVCRAEDIIHSRVPAAAASEPYDLILVGKPTDSSGLGGASFASVTLTGSQESLGAVQLPDPFLKRVLLAAQQDVQRMLKESGAEVGFKDLGAGGIGCVASEIAAASGFGVEIDLDLETKVPDDLPAEFVLVAETQERFAWAVPARLTPEVLRIYNERFGLPRMYPGAGARILGRFAGHGRFVVRHGGRVVADVPNELITSGISVHHPVRRRAAPAPLATPAVQDVLALLESWSSSPAAASRRPIYRFYDSEVKGRAILRPGEADAGMFLLRWGGPEGIAVTVDGSPGPLEADPRGGAGIAVCEVCRNLAATGAEPLALTDCLNFGNPEDPDVMGEFEDVLEGLGQAARAFGVKGGGPLPFISGNVSLYNQRSGARSIPPSPIVAGVGLVPDYGSATTPRLKQPGNPLMFLGRRRGAFAGSWAAASVGLGGRGALPDPAELGAQVRREVDLVLEGIRAGRVHAAHDVAEGGALWTALEMAMDSGDPEPLGIAVEEEFAPWMLEEHCGFLLEVSPGDSGELQRRARESGLECFAFARIIPGGTLRLRQGAIERSVALATLAEARSSVLKGIVP